MQTYVTVYVSSDGTKASEVTRKLLQLGFEATFGNHEFIYEWEGKDASATKVLEFVDQVQAALRGTGCLLHFTTVM